MRLACGSILLFGALLFGPVACDDEDGESGDESSDMTDAQEEGSAEGEGVEACVDGEQTVAVGDTRGCDCMDGSASTQMCLSTGQFGVCDCAGW
jgi:hypothetical protein